MFNIIFSIDAEKQWEEISIDPSRRRIAKAVYKTIEIMKANIRHPSLNTHKYDDFKGPHGEDIFESYAQNKTPGAYRIFWFYGPKKSQITILSIVPHP